MPEGFIDNIVDLFLVSLKASVALGSVNKLTLHFIDN
jgi:hypothetical protein